MTQFYTLTPFQTRLLQVMEYAPERSAAQAAALLRCRPSAVAYALRALRADRIITLRPIINYAQLGYMNIGVYFSLRSARRDRVEAFLSSLAQRGEVAWLGSLAGAFQYGMAVLVPSLTGFGDFLRELGEHNQSLLAARVAVPRLSVVQYPRFAIPRQPRPPSVIAPTRAQPTAIDALDHAVLHHLCNGEFESIRDVARQLSASTATVERRVTRLEREGVIVRWTYAVNTDRLGRHAFRLLLSTPHSSTTLEGKLREFCSRHPAITLLIQCLGGWDYELEVEVEDPKAITPIAQQLLEAFEGVVEEVQICSELTDWKFSLYPFRDMPGNVPRAA